MPHPTATLEATVEMPQRCFVAALVIAPLVAVLACGETRRPIGDECLRDEDCLSNVCAARVCAAAPALIAPPDDPVPDEVPRLPDASSSRDAPAGG